uniref:Plastid light harvesting protein n=1 Tax=Pseudictyota dubia TaxID=2749911 RepID=A0A7R9VJ99_9STRA|mmetsp:Transcript_14772/g.28319  ORF Transcript_14772/g.28319 Transcript_14772/m.28319 type:complete len:214 (+) Transcript_14772:59-700(+)
MKLAISSVALMAGSAAAFGPFGAKAPAASTPVVKSFADDLVGALPPVGFWDPLGFAEKANDSTLKRYREAELTHGRVAMLAVLGFLVGEKVEGNSFLFDAQVSGPAITHIGQVPEGFWALLLLSIGAAEQFRAEKGWVDPSEVPIDQPGLLRAEYVPGDLGFDPLGLKPEDPEEFREMQTKELQNGRLAMLAAAGFLAQEAADGKGIIEHFMS